MDNRFLDAIKILEEGSVPYWACFGTLLGMWRNGDILPWDRDIDIGIMVPFEGQLVDTFPKFEKLGYEVRANKGKESNSYSLKQRGHLPLSFGIWELDGNNLIQREKRGRFVVPKEYIMPNIYKAFKQWGLWLRVPRDPPKFLEACYGDWRTVQTGYKYYRDCKCFEPSG